MAALRRRSLLSTLGTLAAAGTLAGCLDGTPVDGESDGHDYLREDDVVDYPGMVDGAASVSPDERTIEYDDPEVTFELEAGYRGESADESDLRVGRDLSGETMAAFVAPVYDDADGRFRYHAFANAAFVEFADWNVVAQADMELEDLGSASFEHLQGDVYGFAVVPESVDGIVVVDETADSLETTGEDDSTGVVLFRAPSNNVETTAPNVHFQFDYDSAAEHLVITHAGGDVVRAAQLQLHSRDEMTVEEDFEGDVRAGDTATVSVASDASVRVVWESDDGDQSATLATWSAPDA